MQKYIEMLETEINRLMETEKQHGRVNIGVEQQLHFLLENRRHAIELADEYRERGKTFDNKPPSRFPS